jgi:hypothetical protein
MGTAMTPVAVPPFIEHDFIDLLLTWRQSVNDI